MSRVNTLYENIEPYSTGYLEIDGHEIYYENVEILTGSLLSFFMEDQVVEVAQR